MDQPGNKKVVNPARGQLNRKNVFFYCSFATKYVFVWSRETGSAVPSRVSLLILHNQAESDWLVLANGIPPAFRGGAQTTLPYATIGSVPS